MLPDSLALAHASFLNGAARDGKTMRNLVYSGAGRESVISTLHDPDQRGRLRRPHMANANIPAGLCQCGCGRATRLAPRTSTRRGWVRGQPMAFFGHHRPGSPGGALHHNWKGGRKVNDQGYILVAMHGHPRADRHGYVREHVLIAERALGHFLRRDAQVHHVDQNRANNAAANLVVCHNRAYHALLHQRQRALDACGDPSAHRCSLCSGYDRQEEIVSFSKGKPVWIHPSCQQAYKRRKREGVR